LLFSFDAMLLVFLAVGSGFRTHAISQLRRQAAEASIFHRELKPSNIFAARRGGMDDVAKLFDFGLVMPVARTGAPQMSGPGQVLGTPQRRKITVRGYLCPGSPGLRRLW
jgi:serine/threonine protein kinase